MQSTRLSLRRRFLISVGLLALVVAAIGVGLAVVYDQELEKATSRQVLSTLEQIAEGVETELSRIRLLAAAVAQDDSLPLIAGLADQPNAAQILETNREVDKRLDRLFGLVRHEVMALLFFRTDGSVESYRGTLVPGGTERIRNSGFYRQALGRSGSTLDDSLEPVPVTSGTSQFQLSVAIRPEPAGTGLEMIYLGMVPDFFNRIIGRLGPGADGTGHSFYAILGQDGRILFPTAELRRGADEGALGQVALGPQTPGPVLIRGDKGTYLVTARNLERVPWRIAYFSDWERLTEGSSRANAWALALLLVVLGAFVFFFQRLRREILVPLQVLTDRMHGYGLGRSLPDLELRLAPEFGQVFGQFDLMVAQIDQLTREKIDAERAALQFQINPHFLSNTLSALRFMAMMSKAEGMKAMVEALMDMMSYQLSAPANRSTVEAELENIRRYEYIMKVRYGDTFDLTAEVAPGLGSHPLLTMLLQPVVENAIEHGLPRLDRRGEIRLTVDREAGSLWIRVRDNGVGMTAPRQAELLQPGTRPGPVVGGATARQGRIGLWNVHQRIQSHYGPDFGLTISSTEGEGTEIAFRLPYHPAQEAEHG